MTLNLSIKERSGEWKTESWGEIVKYNGNLLLFECKAFSFFIPFSLLSKMLEKLSDDWGFYKESLKKIIKKMLTNVESETLYLGNLLKCSNKLSLAENFSTNKL